MGEFSSVILRIHKSDLICNSECTENNNKAISYSVSNTAFQYHYSQLSNAQNDLWSHPWRNVILSMSLSVCGELETRVARIIRRLSNDSAQISRDSTLSEM